MKNKLISVVLVLLLVGVAVFVFLPGSGQASMLGNVTVYVKEADSGEQLQAEIDGSGADTGEQFLMSMGQGIRTMDFTGSLTGIYKTANYEVWAVAVMNVKGTGLKSVSTTSVVFTGLPGAGTGTNPIPNPYVKGALITSALATSVSLSSPVAVLNGNTTYDMSTGDKFDRIDCVSGVSHANVKLFGDYLNGMKIMLSAHVTGLGPSNIPVSGWTNETFTVSVTNFLTASITLTVTSMTVSGNAIVLAIMPFAETLAEQEAMVKN
jgi:hypothetical protein